MLNSIRNEEASITLHRNYSIDITMSKPIFGSPVDEAEQGFTLAQISSRPGSSRLIEGVLFSREFVPTYNALLLLLLLCYTTYRYFYVDERSVKRCRQLIKFKDSVQSLTLGRTSSKDLCDEEQEQYSSNHISNKETTPLLPHGEVNKRTPSLYHLTRAFLMYQPAKLPVLRRPLPSNGISIIVILLIAINAFYLLFQVPLDLRYAFVFADRAGLLFVVNLPFLYLLSAKNQPLKGLLGHSHEALNIYHRKLGEILTFLALIHFTGMIYVWYSILRPVGFSFGRFVTSKIVLLGLLAYGAYNVIYLTSLRSFRQRCYEAFLLLHIILQVAALILLWFHHRNGRPYIAAALGLFIVDRLYLRYFKSVYIRARLNLMKDGSTILVSANWSIIKFQRKHWARFVSVITPHTVFQGWQPGDHVFLAIPSLSRTSKFQNHPFTIASAAPTSVTMQNDSEAPHAWFSVLVRSREGFSALLRDAASNSKLLIKEIDVRLDGPYGSGTAIRMLKRSNVTLVVAGGSGVAVAFPMVWALLSHRSKISQNESDEMTNAPNKNYDTKIRHRDQPQSIALLWVIHSATHRSWIPEENFQELQAKGLQLYITPPTREAGRPNISGFVRRYISDTSSSVEHFETPNNAPSSVSGSSSSSDITATNRPLNTYTKDNRKGNNSFSITNSPTHPQPRNLNKNNKIAVLVSGPHSMNREVRNTCASMVGREGWDIDVAVEQFEW